MLRRKACRVAILRMATYKFCTIVNPILRDLRPSNCVLYSASKTERNGWADYELTKGLNETRLAYTNKEFVAAIHCSATQITHPWCLKDYVIGESRPISDASMGIVVQVFLKVTVWREEGRMKDVNAIVGPIYWMSEEWPLGGVSKGARRRPVSRPTIDHSVR